MQEGQKQRADAHDNMEMGSEDQPEQGGEQPPEKDIQGLPMEVVTAGVVAVQGHSEACSHRGTVPTWGSVLAAAYAAMRQVHDAGEVSEATSGE